LMGCLASLHYLNRVFQGNKERTLKTLIERKPHLNITSLNEAAYEMVTSLA